VNDAVQKYGEDYGKYEPGNKISYADFQKFLTEKYPEKYINMERDIMS
jgi:tubulin monoglycylase TTLL3/8